MYYFLINLKIYLLFFLAGSTINSFIGLVVDRLPHQLKWHENALPNINIFSPGSHCNSCSILIKWYYLIPIFGYLLSKSVCPYCGYKITKTYPILEFLGGLVAIILLYLFGLNRYLAIYWLLFSCLTFLSWIDVKEYWLPAIITFPLLFAGIFISPSEINIVQRLAGSCIAFLSITSLMLIVGKALKKTLWQEGILYYFQQLEHGSG